MPNIRPPQRRSLTPIQPVQPKDFTQEILAVQGQNPLAEAIKQVGNVSSEVIKRRADLAKVMALGKQLGLSPEQSQALQPEDESALRQLALNRMTETPEIKQKAQLELKKLKREAEAPYPQYAIPEYGASGQQTGLTYLPAGIKPAGIVRPQVQLGQMEDQTYAKELAKAKVKAKVELAEQRPQTESAISEINRVQKLNKNTYGGAAGSATFKLQSALNVGNDEKFKNTADVINTMQASVAKVLKSTFGGQLSDAEREYLNQVYGALPKMSQAERDIAMTNVKTMLSNKLSGSESKLNELSGIQSSKSILKKPQEAKIVQTRSGTTFKITGK